MWNNHLRPLLGGLLLIVAVSCEKETATPANIDLLSIQINGANLMDGAQDVPVSASLDLVFSASLQRELFASAFSITSDQQEVAGTIRYANQSSRVSIDLELNYQTVYTLTIATTALTTGGATLPAPLSYRFTTAADGTIYRLPACTGSSADCLREMQVDGLPNAKLKLYSSFPLSETEAEWLDLKTAIIVVHGANRNADDYFDYLSGALQEAALEKEVLLLAPFFRQAAEADTDELYWSGNDWRAGQPSANTTAISSFAVVDQLIDRLSDEVRYPALEQIVITGHSSGGLFTHLYAVAGQAKERHPELSYQYWVANSQYFYYPDGQRIDEATNSLYSPTGCTGYDFWPLGFAIRPPYLNMVEEATFNQRFVVSPITYLLGNGSGPDGAFNRTDCAATLLGSSRYQRGENMLRYMELRYAGGHQHQQLIIQGVGHDGAGVYQSPEFGKLLSTLAE